MRPDCCSFSLLPVVLLLAAFCLLPWLALAEPENNTTDEEPPAEQAEDTQDEAVPQSAGGMDAPAVEIVDLPLDTSLRFIIQPTILGLVPPREAAGYGEVFVRITGIEPGRFDVHYEIKEELPLPEDGSIEARPGAETYVSIRRGEVVVDGVDSSAEILPPLYWDNGNFATESALLWLSRSSFNELRETGMCPLMLEVEGDNLSAAAAELNAAVEGLGGGDSEDALLFVDQLLYPCVVNGQRARVHALHCRDSLGLAEYWVLDDNDNPLVLKLTYTLGDDEEQGDLSFIRRGGGYAVTSVDFTPQP